MFDKEEAVNGKKQLKQLSPLDFDKLKNFLKTSNDEMKVCATLQALRWRSTRVSIPVKK